MLVAPNKRLRLGGSADFSGSASCELKRTISTINQNSFTVGVWINVTNITFSYFQRVFAIDDGSGNFTSVRFLTGASQINLDNNPASNDGVTLTQNVWYFIGVISSASACTLYYRSRTLGLTQTVSNGASSTGNAGANVMYVGNEFGGTSALIGYMAGFKLWNYPLTTTALARESRQLAPVNEAGLLAYLPLASGASPGIDQLNGISWTLGSGTIATATLRPPVPDVAVWKRKAFLFHAALPTQFQGWEPDWLTRPALHTSQYQAFTAGTVPIVNTVPTQFPASYPDNVRGAALHVSQMPWVTGLSPKPERTLPPAFESHPDRVERPALHPGAHLFVTSVSPAPERTSVLAAAAHPDRLERPALASAQHPSITQVYPRPERTSPIAATVFADRAPGTSLPIALHPVSFAASPTPERTTAIASVLYPDRVERSVLVVASMPVATQEPPAPERIQAIAAVSMPDRLERPALATASHPAVTQEPPRPEAVLPLNGQPFAPDRAPGVLYLAVQQPSFAFYPVPIPNAAAPVEGYASYPDRVDRPGSAALHPFFAFAPSPLPDIPLRWQPRYPDRLERPALHPSEHQAFALDAFPRPTASITLGWGTSYQDRVPGAFLAAAEHPAFAASQAPERTSPLATTAFVDRVERATLPVASYPYVTGEPPSPERKSPLAAVSYPDRTERPSLATAAHLAVTGEPPRPERAAPLASVAHPDRVERVWLQAPHHLPFASNLAPERKSPIAATSHPDRLERPSLHVSSHLFVTGEPPRPEVRSPGDWYTAYPDRVERPALAVAHHPAITFWPKPLPNPVPIYAAGIFPDFAPGVFVHPSQVGTGAAPQPPLQLFVVPMPSAPFVSTSFAVMPISTSVVVTYGSSSR